MKISCTWEFIWKNKKTCSAKAGYLSVWEPEMQEDGKKYVSSSFPYSKFIVFGDWYRSAYRFYYITFSMSLFLYKKKPCNAIPVITMNLHEQSKGHDSPWHCQVLKPELIYFLADTAVFQNRESGTTSLKRRRIFINRDRHDAHTITSDSEL